MKENFGEKRVKILQANFVFNVFLTIFLAVILVWHFFAGGNKSYWALILVSVVGFIPVCFGALKGFWQKRLTIDFLAGLSLVISFIMREWHSAAFICLMLAFARVFHFWTEAKEKKIINRLLRYKPQKIKIKIGEEIKEIPVGKAQKGDLVILESGDFIPIDGVIVSGQAAVNESMLTGESELKLKKIGNNVFSFSVIENGSLVVRAEKVGGESFFAKTLELVESASRKKGKSERIADKFALWYVVGILVLAFISFAIFRNYSLVLSILLVSCADDIAVAIPLSFTIALSRAAKRGVLIKGSETIEKVPKIKFFIADKTGTLTYGRPKIKDIIVFNGFSENDFLKKAGSVFLNSRHPVSSAIVEFLIKERGIIIPVPDKFLEFAGEGLEAERTGEKILAGKLEFLQKKGVDVLAKQTREINEEIEKGLSAIAVAFNGKISGVFVYEDEIRPFSSKLIWQMKKMGVESWTMLTGDNEKVARKTADQLGIDYFRSNLRPEEKLRYIENFKASHKDIIAMIGDGINDVASLAIADVSFAMAKVGAEAAIEAADVALLNDKLERIPEVATLCKKTMRIVGQHFWVWGIFNVIGLVLVFVGVLGPTQAAAYNFITDFVPILNALRLTKVNLQVK